MKKITYLLSAVLAVALALSAFPACKSGAKVGNVEVWSAYDTLKIMQGEHGYEKGEKRIAVEMAKGERESAQLVLTPDYDVRSYTLEVRDLTDGNGHTLAAENVTVYKQHYLNLIQKSDFNTVDAYPAGMIPDMLLPLSTAIEYGENTVKAGNNQSLTVEFATSSQTEAGTYTGVFTLDVDGVKIDIPVTVEVWDFDITSNTGRSSFVLTLENLWRGELSRDPALEDAYYAFLLDYKVNATYLPYTFVSAEKMVESLLKYWDHPAFTTYSLPVGSSVARYTCNKTLYKQYLKAVIKACTPERRLLTKAATYVTLLDEPQQFNGQPHVIREVEALRTAARQTLAELKTEGFFAEFDAGFETDIAADVEAMELVITSPYETQFESTSLTYCPTFDRFDNTLERQNLAADADKKGKETWFYGCVSPRNPYPTYHIDDYLIGARAVGWMQRAYNVSGNLYWCVNSYHNWNNGSRLSTMVDPYNDPMRFISGAGGSSGTAGDGYLLYPGAKYGNNAPYAAIRLAAVRDGQDDYDAVGVLQDRYDALAERFGAGEIDVNAALENTYALLFRGTVYNIDDAAYKTARRTVARLIEAADKVGLVIAGTQIEGTQATTVFYTDSGCAVDVGGQTLEGTPAGSGTRYAYTQSLESSKNTFDLTVTKGDATVKYSSVVAGKVESLDTADVKLVTVSDTGTVTANAQGAAVCVKSKGSTPTEKLSFKPFFAVTTGNLSKLNSLTFTIENKNSMDVTLEVGAGNGRSTALFDAVKIPARATVTVTIDQLSDVRVDSLSSCDRIVFRMANVDASNNLYPDRNFVVSGVYVEKEIA